MARQVGRREARLRGVMLAELARVMPGLLHRDSAGRIAASRRWTVVEVFAGTWRLLLSRRYISAQFGLYVLFLWRWTRRIAIVGALLALIVFSLAQVALMDEVRAARSQLGPDARTAIAQAPGLDLIATGSEDGAARIYRGAKLVGLVRGHGAPIRQAAFLNGGAALLTVDARGESRITQIASLADLAATETDAATEALYTRLWAPFGAPVAKAALYATAQVLPLHVPEDLRGARGAVFRDCPECPEMIPLTGGAFFMGSPWTEYGRRANEGPRRFVKVAPFAAGRFEVSFQEWDACVAAGGCGGYRPPDQGLGRGRRPVINVSWDDAQAYVRWLIARTGKDYRLLSEAEWEFAARAGTTSPYWWGNTVPAGQANLNPLKPELVGMHPSNPFGLHDTAGNVWEWVAECEGSYRSASTNRDCSARVLRGGAGLRDQWTLRSAYRNWGVPTERQYFGIRIARTL